MQYWQQDVRSRMILRQSCTVVQLNLDILLAHDPTSEPSKRWKKLPG